MSDLEEDFLKGDKKIVTEAKRRFKQCQSWESDARNLYLQDLKFANADPDNGYQWPHTIYQERGIENRPCLTVNKTRQHNLQIINDAKKNTPSVKVHPVGGGASFESAQVYEGIIRYIEYISNASVAYDTAAKFQVEGGIGYWRVVTDYAGDDSFDQEIFIRRIKDPLTVYIDPDINEKDGSDARFAFVYEDMPRDEFNAQYPKYKDKVNQSPLGSGDGNQSWMGKDHVRIAEYFRCVPNTDRIIAFTNPETGEQEIIRERSVKGAMKRVLKQVIDAPETKIRTVIDNKVEWYLIIGEEIAERRVWPGKYIPIIRVIGEETIIDGKLDRKGHTRALKDPQRMFNYFASAAVEFVALQSKIPFVGSAAAIEGLETYWETANTTNHSILPYNHLDDEGNPLTAPSRMQAPIEATGYLQAMVNSEKQMMMASGQYEANFGEKSNERSGVAINERQRQGDTATYHYIDNQAIGIRFTGKILIDLVPKIYDTPRIIRILAEDGVETMVQLDPKAKQAYFEHTKEQADEVKAIFNPNVGKYDVQADVGPGFATRREETANALTQVIQQQPAAFTLLGDFWAENSDFPGADKMAERLRNMLPPQAKGEGMSAQEMALQSQIQQATALNTKLMEQLAEERFKAKTTDEQKEIDTYKAITERIKVILPTILNPKDIAMMIHDLMVEERRATLPEGQLIEGQPPQKMMEEPTQGVMNG